MAQIPLKSWQTTGIFGSCQILGALGEWSIHSITTSLLSRKRTAFSLHYHTPLLDAVGVTVLSQFWTMVSLQEKNALICGFRSHDKVLGLTISSKYLKYTAWKKTPQKKICWPYWKLLKFRFTNWVQHTIQTKLFRDWNQTSITTNKLWHIL